jgi:hypothetical protein
VVTALRGVTERPACEQQPDAGTVLTLADFSTPQGLISGEPERTRHRPEVPDIYKYPCEIQFVTALPKTVSGEVRRSDSASGSEREPSRSSQP